MSVACAPADRGRLRIAVADTGYGIPADQLGRLFQPFERLDAGQTVEGTGMGLALSKGLVEAMGGTIGVDSEIDQGTTFWVELATAADQVEAYENGRHRPAVTTLHGPTRTVLHIEDNLSNLKLVERILAIRHDVTLLTAMQGGLGMELARQHRPDLVLLDLHLPDVPGRAVLRRLRTFPETRAIPIIVISADATRAQVSALTAAGAAGYLTKPLDVEEFLETVNRALGSGVPGST